MFDSSQIQPYISFTDLREWMAEADALGELKTVLGASWQQEIGLATDVVVPPDDDILDIFYYLPTHVGSTADRERFLQFWSLKQSGLNTLEAARVINSAIAK